MNESKLNIISLSKKDRKFIHLLNSNSKCIMESKYGCQ